MNEPTAGERFLPVRAASVESGLSERTIYDKASKGTIRQRRNAEGQIEVDISQLEIAPGTSLADEQRRGDSNEQDLVARERAQLAALRVQREREEFEASVRRERREEELHEERLQHERRVAEQDRQYAHQLAQQQAVLREGELKLKQEKEQRLRLEERNAMALKEEEASLRAYTERLEREALAHYDSECGKLERLLVALVAMRRGYEDSQRMGAVIRQLACAYRETRDFESLQFNAALALQEI